MLQTATSVFENAVEWLNSSPRRLVVLNPSITWLVTCSGVGPGDYLVVVGPSEALGEWDPTAGFRLALTGADQCTWRGSIDLPMGFLTWKFAIVHSDGHHVWEGCENREILVPRMEKLCIRATFGDDSQIDVLPSMESEDEFLEF